MIKGGHTPELGKPGGRGGIWRGGLGEHGDGEREDDQEATGRWDPDRGVAFGATPQTNCATPQAYARGTLFYEFRLARAFNRGRFAGKAGMLAASVL